tara:strand:+ start:5183 stop:5539 length:357 start_codon:yes stop_codon:yes gene_type:complete
MPIYLYKHPDTGEQKSVMMSMNEMWEKTKGDNLVLDGIEWVRDISAEHGTQVTGGRGWPLYSEAAGTHPDEVGKSMKDMRAKGVNLNYTKDGRAIFENATQRRKALKALGMQDMQGYD